MFLLATLLKIYGYLIIARAIISWMNPNPGNPAIRFIHTVTDPVLEPIRRILPSMGGVDFSPFVAMIIIWFLMSLV